MSLLVSGPTYILLALCTIQGYGAIPPARGLSAMALVLQAAPAALPAVVMASPFDWNQFLTGLAQYLGQTVTPQHCHLV